MPRYGGTTADSSCAVPQLTAVRFYYTADSCCAAASPRNELRGIYFSCPSSPALKSLPEVFHHKIYLFVGHYHNSKALRSRLPKAPPTSPGESGRRQVPGLVLVEFPSSVAYGGIRIDSGGPFCWFGLLTRSGYTAIQDRRPTRLFQAALPFTPRKALSKPGPGTSTGDR